MRSLAVACIALVALSAQADTLDFSGDICSAAADGTGEYVACADFGRINQAYGDSATVNLTYQSSPDAITSMFFWSTGYSGLSRVAYGDTNATPTILIVPTTGQAVTLASFQLGSWNNLDRDSQVTVIDLADQSVVLSTGTITVQSAVPSSFSIGASSSAGFSIAFGPEGFNVGIDNIQFSTSPVPEPATTALWLAGLATAAVAARRRRSA
jgi:hypothetical protein